MYTLGLDTIAGAKLLQVKFGLAAAFQPDQAVMHKDERARFSGASGGAAIIRHPGDRHPLAVPLDALSLPPEEQGNAAKRVAARANARQAQSAPDRSGLVVPAEVGWLSRDHPQRRPMLRP